MMKLRDYMDKNSISDSSMAHFLGVSAAAVFNWKTGARMPRMQYLQKISEYTQGQVTANDFVEPKKKLADKKKKPV
jgi:transcriptional regulator with XRE-family HTH domain